MKPYIETIRDIVAAVFSPDVELFGEGQCLYKEPVGGHPKNLLPAVPPRFPFSGPPILDIF
jgi:hypothetical protein